MTWKTNPELMAQGNEKRKERNLTARIGEQEEEAEERTRNWEKLNEKWAEMSKLLAEHRANAVKLTESFNRLKEAYKR